MKITETEKTITIDGENMTTCYIKPNENAITQEGDNCKQLIVTGFHFITDTNEYFGKEIKFNNKTYKYIGIEKSTGVNVFWDIENRRIMTSEQP